MTHLPAPPTPHTKNANHKPRIKISQSYALKVLHSLTFSMTIDDSPRVLGKTGEISASDVHLAEAFVKRNKDLLLSYWHLEEGYIDTLTVLNALERV